MGGRPQGADSLALEGLPGRPRAELCSELGSLLGCQSTDLSPEWAAPLGRGTWALQLGVAAWGQKEEGPGRVGKPSEIPSRKDNRGWLW